MKRALIRHIAPEMLGLLLVEAGLSMFLARMLLAPASPDLPDQGLAFRQALVVAIAVGFTSFLLGAYRPAQFARTRHLLVTTMLGGVLAFPAAWVAMSLLGLNADMLVGHDPAWPTKILVTWLAAVLAIRLTFQAAVRSRLFTRRVAVVGSPAGAAGVAAAIRADRAASFEVVPVPAGGAAELRTQGIRTMLVPVADAERCAAERAAYVDAGVTVLDEPLFWERHLRRVDIAHLTPAWFAELGRRPRGRILEACNRAGDIVTSLAILVFTLPLVALVALAIRLDSPGAVLYRQERVGKDGKTFVLLKFRSMNSNAEARGPAWAQQRDPRVTRVGGIMRRTRIDELPQLVNVLRGEMSLIGPRPERPHFVEQLADVIPFYRERARVKPGLTGWAQVNYPYGASVEDARAKLSYDLYYVKNQSVMLDLMILFATVRVILFQEGAR